MLIAEEFLLLTLDDESGKISFSGASSFPFGMVGSLVLELVFLGRITLKDKHVRVINTSHTGDPLLDDVLKRMGDLNRDLRLRSWIIQLSVVFRNIYSKGLLSRLTDQGMLIREEKPRLKIFHSMRHPLVRPELKNELLQRLQGIILDKQEATTRDTALLCLVHDCGLIGSLFMREYRGLAEARIKELRMSEKLEPHDKEIINSMSETLVGLLYQPPFKTPRKILPKLFKKKSS